MKSTFTLLALSLLLLGACTQKVDSNLSIAPENFPMISFKINSGEPMTKNSIVNLQIQSSRPDLEKVTISYGTNCESQDWQAYSQNIVFDLGSQNGERFVSLKGRTIYGFSSECVSQKIILDTTSPTVTGLEVPAKGIYGSGEDLTFKVNFSEKVFVVGSPRLLITIGSSTRYANYVSVSESQSLLFKYTLQASDFDLDGIALATDLDLNGSTISDEVTNSATLSLPTVATNSIIVGCPTNFVRVPALSPYTTSSFCVGKYETKILGQADGAQTYDAALVPEVRASGTPWTRLTRDSAIAECQSLGTGYDLISNA